MTILLIEGGKPLTGEVTISGAKNSSLPAMAACILAEGTMKLHNVPDVLDVHTMKSLLESLGMESKLENNVFSCDGALTNTYVRHEIASKMRASFLALGPLLAKYKRARIALPGGCVIGDRPVNFHLDALSKMGASIRIKDGYVHATTMSKLKGSCISFPQVSVGATQNILMAACLADGETVIKNASQEPEVTDLIAFVNKMGAKIERTNSSEIKIIGVSHLKGASHRIITDRIEAITYAVAAAITNGKITINDVDLSLCVPAIDKLRSTGVRVILRGKRKITVQRESNIERLKAMNITTNPHPGFPSDLQSQFTAMLALAEGTSTVHETLFENRFLHIKELNRMGANISINNNHALIRGVRELNGNTIVAKDLRGAASLILAALAAKGETIIKNPHYAYRGYSGLITKLNTCSGSITEIASQLHY